MKILLTNFGTYTQKEFEFKNNKFILFKGENGSGKSTVFKAIAWVLYGKYKTVRKGCAACEVVLQDRNWIVKRTSKPQTLKLRFEGEDYEGSAAQKLVYKLIGSNWDQFRLSTMIDSNSRSSLASITPGERFSVIRELVSTLDEPQQDLEKILAFEKGLRSGEDMSKGELNILKQQVEEAKRDLESMDKPVVESVDEEERDRLETLLEKDRAKRERWVDFLSSGLTKEGIQERLAQLEALPSLLDKLKMMKRYLVYSKHIASVQATKKDFEKGKKLHFKNLKKELKTLEKKECDPESLKEVARELGVRKDAKDEGNPYWDLEPHNIEELLEERKEDQKVVHLKSTKQKCPHCSKNVAINDNKILKWLKKWNHVEDCDDVHHLEALEDLVYEVDLEANEKWEESVTVKNRIKELKRMIDGEILSTELIRLRKSFGEEIEEPDGYKEKYTVEYLEGRIEELTKELGGIREEEDGEREKLEGMLSSKIIPTKKKLNTLNKRIKETEQKLDEFRAYEKQLSDKKEYERLKKVVKTTKKTIKQIEKDREGDEKIKADIARLKVLQKEAEIMSMQNVVDTINNYSADYLQKFFDEAITVELTLTKRTQKGVKLSLDIDINFNGLKYDISEFSQGELIKINLAFILSMNRLQNSKYLFLDEVLQNLDRNILLEIYDCLSSITDEVSVYVIDHNSVEGFFDEVVEFKKN